MQSLAVDSLDSPSTVSGVRVCEAVLSKLSSNLQACRQGSGRCPPHHLLAAQQQRCHIRELLQSFDSLSMQPGGIGVTGPH